MIDEPPRPDPDALLRRVSDDAHRDSRGSLKVFLGFAPGVGKTYRMLLAAREAARRGRSVLVGVVETHGRAETAALLAGLEVLPRREITHRGQALSEFDLDQALALEPELILVDELAHTNAPGSRHTKRFQDIEELLDAGIDVWTTVNIQHIESLLDVVEQITGVLVRENVPDRLIDRASEVELVDLPPEKLVERLREGKVYGGPQSAIAQKNFFRLGNLMALREIALRRTAERVDVDVRAYRRDHSIEDTWRASDRILVCAGPAPGSATVIRAARRLAAGLRAPWAAIYVDSPLAPLSERDRATLEDHLRLAESLGAEIVRLSSSEVANTILAHARRHNVTKILVGKPTHPRLRDRLRGSLLDALVRESGGIDVHVVSGDTADKPRAVTPRKAPSRAREAVLATMLIAAATALGEALRVAVDLPDVEMLYLVAVMISAAAWGRRVAVLAAGLSVLAFNFFFVPPYFTLMIADNRFALTFVMMFIVGLVTSELVSRLKAQEEAARLRELRTRAFYSLARDLGLVETRPDVARALARHVSEAFSTDVAVIRPPETLATFPEAFAPSADDLAVARWAFDNGRSAGSGTDTLPASATMSTPLRHGGVSQGVLTLRANGPAIEGERATLLDGLARLGAMALARADLADEARSAEVRVRAEELRSALLSGVSHDLRTPLAAITGAATTLRNDGGALSDAQRRDLVEAICEESGRLDRLATNLLDMTRLQSGPVILRREWVPLEEVVGSALQRLENAIGARPVTVAIPDGLPLLSVDPVLFQQVFVNLVENALKYTPASSRIDVRAEASADRIDIDVMDDGPGINAPDRDRVFEKFYRGGEGRTTGFGLGLPICRGIVEAHGGTLALVPSEKGARFRISLPRMEAPRTMEPGARV